MILHMNPTSSTAFAPSAPPFCIQIYIDPTLAYFRETILGIRQYAFQSGRLHVLDRWVPPERMNPSDFGKSRQIHGIIAAIHSPAIETKFNQLGVPVVNVSNTMPVPKLTVVTQDDYAVGRMAGEHLISVSGQRYAFWGQREARYTSERFAGFKDVVEKSNGVIDYQEMEPAYGKREYNRILRWLSQKQTPLAVFAVLDRFAVMIIRASRELGLSIPDDLAVLGAGDDEFFIAYENIPLSSVKLPARRIGYEAGCEIDRLLSNHLMAGTGVRLPPLGITARHSTDTIFVNDEVIVKALRYIRDHATENPYIEDVAKASGVARTTLQKKFQKTLGHTMLDEIHSVRIRYAKDLLLNTNLSLEFVAERCGFSNSQRFSVAFRKTTGVPPGAYRKSFGCSGIR